MTDGRRKTDAVTDDSKSNADAKSPDPTASFQDDYASKSGIGYACKPSSVYPRPLPSQISFQLIIYSCLKEP